MNLFKSLSKKLLIALTVILVSTSILPMQNTYASEEEPPKNIELTNYTTPEEKEIVDKIEEELSDYDFNAERKNNDEIQPMVWGKIIKLIINGITESIEPYFDDKQIQAKYKHAKDFGVYGSYNKENAKKFLDAVDWHIQTATEIYVSTYHGQQVLVWIKPNDLMVYTEMDGDFISGWKATKDQLNFHRENGAAIKRERHA
ncbi:colicin D domain-containing protein [Brevibacillus daliensis]|uniref:colicin D domain-containing protein n=1 Tax=Brevibacillus daliensis TaxID=2892995 RepID=UPI001E3755E4|nr:colicin D domain-containing protein [Brevibacillus daliensis]